MRGGGIQVCLVLLWLVNAILNLTDCKFNMNSAIEAMEDGMRKQYRRRIGLGYIGLMLVAIGIFVAEFVYGVRLGLGLALVYYGIPYMIPAFYIFWVNEDFHVF